MSIQDRAKEAASYFETAHRKHAPEVRAEDAEQFVRIKDGAPEWVMQLAFKAHGDLLPDDFRFQVIREALDALADQYNDDDDFEQATDEFADDVDVYTSDLTAWLGSHSSRPGYCDEAREEMGTDSRGIVQDIQRGQYMERREVFQLVVEALREVDA